MTIRIEPSTLIESETHADVDMKSDKTSPAILKNEELQKHLEAAGYLDETDQYLMFALNQDDYAVDILRVKEILDIPLITRVPRTPSFMLGVINLRGSVVPVLDLKQRFGFNKTAYTENSCIIIVEVESNNASSRIFGLLVDAVEEVINLTADLIDEVTKVGVHINTDFLQGVGNHNGSFLIILDLQKVLPLNETF